MKPIRETIEGVHYVFAQKIVGVGLRGESYLTVIEEDGRIVSGFDPQIAETARRFWNAHRDLAPNEARTDAGAIVEFFFQACETGSHAAARAVTFAQGKPFTLSEIQTAWPEVVERMIAWARSRCDDSHAIDAAGWLIKMEADEIRLPDHRIVKCADIGSKFPLLQTDEIEPGQLERFRAWQALKTEPARVPPDALLTFSGKVTPLTEDSLLVVLEALSVVVDLVREDLWTPIADVAALLRSADGLEKHGRQGWKKKTPIELTESALRHRRAEQARDLDSGHFHQTHAIARELMIWQKRHGNR